MYTYVSIEIYLHIYVKNYILFRKIIKKIVAIITSNMQEFERQWRHERIAHLVCLFELFIPSNCRRS